LKHIIVVLAVAAIVTVASTVGNLLLPGPTEQGSGCKGLLNAAAKGGNPKAAIKTAERGCLLEEPSHGLGGGVVFA